MSAVTFNASFYLQQNPDVLAAVSRGQITAEQHFQQFGQFEGRDPNEFFDTEYYLAQNPDVLAAIANPANTAVTSAFQHFVTFGVSEGLVRRPSEAFETFNPNTYIAQNPDLQAAFGSLTGQAQANALFQHFLQFGVNEDRPGSGVDLDVGTPGITLNFTAGVDTLVGTVNDDTFVAGSQAVLAADGTTVTTPAVPGLGLITAKDTVNGGSGFDTVLVNGGAGTLAAATFTSIEAFEFDRTTGIKADLSGVASVEEVTFDRTTGANNLTVSSSAVDVVFDNVDAGTQTINYKAGTTAAIEVAGGSAGLALVVNAATADTLTAVNVNSTGLLANSIASISGGGKFTTLNISGNADLSVAAAALDEAVTTINGAQASGDLTLDLTTAQNYTVTGGSGDDIFVFGGQLKTTDVVNGGAGFDTVSVLGANYSAAAAAAPFNALTSIERVAFTGSDAAILDGATFTNTAITNLLFNTTGTGIDVVNAAGSARTYEFGTDNEGGATFNMKADATTLNLDLLGTTGANDASVGNVVVNLASPTAVATINLTSAGTLTTGTGATTFSGSVFNDVGIVTAATGSTVVIDGSGNLDIAGFTNRVNVDASAHTGLLVIEGSQAAAEGTLVITAGFVASDVITLGQGRATVEFDSALDSGVFVGTGAATSLSVDVINGFTAGANGDILDFTGTTNTFVAVGANQDAINGATSLTDAANIAANSVGGTTDGVWTAFSFGGQTYALYDADGLASGGFVADEDVLVQLNGVTVADLTGDNFA